MSVSKKEKNPFKEFAERSEEIRKRPLDKEKVKRINELARELELEEEDDSISDEQQIACEYSSEPLEAQL